MSLNLGCDFTPHIRWMASTASWKISTENGADPVEWQHAIFDLAGIQTGWGMFNEGEAPEWVMDPSLTQKAPVPLDGRDWKRGFKLNLFSVSKFGGAREFATTATGACKGIAALYNAFEGEASSHPGKVPVVAFEGATPAKIGKGNTNIPKLRIVRWANRPAELPASKAKRTDCQAPLATENADGKLNDDLNIIL